MDGGGFYTSGDLPDDGDGRAEDAVSGAQRWLPPEDRLWRHPSEIARHGLPSSPHPLLGSSGGAWARRRLRRSSILAGIAGVASVATAAAVATAVIDASGTGSERSGAPATNAVTIATTSATSLPAISRDVLRLVQSLRPSLVGLEPVGSSGTHMTGVVLPGGALVVTAAAAVAGVSQMDVVTSDGKVHRGEVVGTDSRSGVAVVSTDGGLAPATFADEPVGPGDFALVACLCATTTAAPKSHAAAQPHAAMSTVKQVGTGVSLGGGVALVDAIEAEMPLGRTAWGGVLVDSHGRVIGVLDGVTTSTDEDPLGVFVPAPLAEGVAQELAQTHRVEHGWLGVVCSDGAVTGATVTRVMPGSPASSAGIRPGDVVEAVANHDIGSLADLQERLYTLPPGDPVQLSVARSSHTIALTATLANSPGS